MEDATALRRRIAEAFTARPYPGDAHLTIRQPDPCAHEGVAIAHALVGRDWRDLGLADLADGSESPAIGAPNAMTVDAFAYYLPAFLLAALGVADKGPRDAATEEDAFVDSLCFVLTAPSPDALAEQYEMVKDLAEVPDDIKAALRAPSPAARATEQALVDRHRRLFEMLDGAERAAVRFTLERLAIFLRSDPPDDRFNNARQALASTWSMRD